MEQLFLSVPIRTVSAPSVCKTARKFGRENYPKGSSRPPVAIQLVCASMSVVTTAICIVSTLTTAEFVGNSPPVTPSNPVQFAPVPASCSAHTTAHFTPSQLPTENYFGSGQSRPEAYSHLQLGMETIVYWPLP